MKTKILAFAVLIQLLILPNVALAGFFQPLQAYANDTVAGYSTVLTSSQTGANKEITFTVQKPDQSIIEIPAKTDKTGIAKVDLYDYHTRIAGEYFVGIEGSNIENGFTVYPDSISSDKSLVSAARTIVKADLIDQTFIQVILKDNYGNPFPSHQVNLISSRSADKITPNNVNSLTDENGSATFTVSSSEDGISSFTAIDATFQTVLNERAKVAFTQGYLEDAGGDFGSLFNIASAQESGSLDHFEIGDLPSTIKPGQNLSFSVKALDSDDQVVQNYTGTVHFSVEGDNSSGVSLPEDYTFKAEDIGKHTFSLGLKFTLAGTYVLTVADIDSSLIQGEKTIIVGDSGPEEYLSTSEKPTITSPVSGTYSQNTQTITGTAKSGRTIKIYNNTQEIGQTLTQLNGKFTFETEQLSDGSQKIYVVALDENDSVVGTSDTVEFKIDTGIPTVDEVTLNPTTEIHAGDIINVEIISEENLAQAAMVFNSDIYPLNVSIENPSKYIGSLSAPDEPGVYPIDFVLVDDLGNEASYNAEAQVTVLAGLHDAAEDPTLEEMVDPLDSSNLPSNVSGLISYAGDSKVTLVWDAATDNNSIKNYRIHYGANPLSLDKVVDTMGPSTTWYVPNLTNGETVHFAISAIDNEGNESLALSEIVSGIPFRLQDTLSVPTNFIPPTLDQVLNIPLGFHSAAVGVYEDRPNVTETGPEVIWLIVGSGIGSALLKKFKRKVK